MTTLLLLIIYIAFIGLGLPDSLFGAAWPAIYRELSLPVSWANAVTMLISGGTILSSLLSARLINRFKTGPVTAFSTSLTALALFGFSCSGSMLWLCLFAIPLGLGAGAIDTALNNYVALHYKALHMNLLHCFYGVGVSVSPFFMSLALAGGSWRSGYRTVFYCQLGIAFLTIVSLPLWRRVQSLPDSNPETENRTVPFSVLLRDPAVRSACLVFVGSCGLEYTCGTWGSTFLVSTRAGAAACACRFTDPFSAAS
ncbi:MAG: MFS transporter, partial [Eubacteriales bacterium]|nr:MFS transporter [Eubacteriales bacterium]